jgi:hypothetical protein
MSFVRKNLFALVRVAKDQVLTVHANKALSGQPKALVGRYEICCCDAYAKLDVDIFSPVYMATISVTIKNPTHFKCPNKR